MVRFDTYVATTEVAKRDDLLQILVDVAGVGSLLASRVGRGYHTFGERLSVRDDCGEWASVSSGGKQGARVMLEIKGERTPAVVDLLRQRYPEHRCTRVDSCADFDAPDAFDRLCRICRKVKREHGIWGDKRGDWDDHPEMGRTLYLGAQTSATRARLYEKGKQPDYVHLGRPDWVRLEVQVRPQKQAREIYSGLAAEEVWGAAKWSRALADAALQSSVGRNPAGSTYRHTTRQQALQWMVRQYGRHLMDEADALGYCGDYERRWEALGVMLGGMVADLSRGELDGHEES